MTTTYEKRLRTASIMILLISIVNILIYIHSNEIQQSAGSSKRAEIIRLAGAIPAVATN